MLYGTNKRRQMARTILPSTSRRVSAHELTRIRRAHRHQVNQRLQVCGGRGLADFAEEPVDLADAEAYPDHEIRDAVRTRRSGDKVAPLIRWAIGSTRQLRQEDRLSHLAAELPANLIGAHAISHLASVDELVIDAPHRHYDYRWRDPSPKVPSRDELARACRQVIERGEHGELNAFLKQYRPGSRLLLGLHDLEDFVEAVYDGRPGQRRAGSELYLGVSAFLARVVAPVGEIGAVI